MTHPDYSSSRQDDGTCPRCGEGQLRAWYELSRDEREVVQRLPLSAELSFDERTARHRWCTRCWHEEADVGIREA